jgi:L-iditol 2-dehydrogenase
VPVPQIGHGELLVRVHTCGVCGTDLKKIASGSHSAPRIFGHETAGIVVAVGDGVTTFTAGDRVMVFHHIPCRECYYCQHKVFAQCPVYKKVGVTAAFEPSGGGFSEYVRVMDWIVQRGGVVRIPDGVSYEQASFIEPVNTCLKGIETLALKKGETVFVETDGRTSEEAVSGISVVARDVSLLCPDGRTQRKSEEGNRYGQETASVHEALKST